MAQMKGGLGVALMIIMVVAVAMLTVVVSAHDMANMEMAPAMSPGEATQAPAPGPATTGSAFSMPISAVMIVCSLLFSFVAVFNH